MYLSLFLSSLLALDLDSVEQFVYHGARYNEKEKDHEVGLHKMSVNATHLDPEVFVQIALDCYPHTPDALF
jgi:hypothetical protein